jgi:hypothetical protein
MSGSVALFATGEHEFDLDAAAEWAKQAGGVWRSASKNDDDVDPEDEVLDDDLEGGSDLDEDDEFDDPEEVDGDEDELDEDELEDDDQLDDLDDDLDDDLIDLDDEYDDTDEHDRGLGGHKFVE